MSSQPLIYYCLATHLNMPRPSPPTRHQAVYSYSSSHTTTSEPSLYQPPKSYMPHTRNSPSGTPSLPPQASKSTAQQSDQAPHSYCSTQSPEESSKRTAYYTLPSSLSSAPTETPPSPQDISTHTSPHTRPQAVTLQSTTPRRQESIKL